MTKWKLVPVELTEEMTRAFAKAFNARRQQETFQKAVVAMLEAAPLEAAPPPPVLSDERILKIWRQHEGQDEIYGFARAIEREILGETEK